MTDAVIAHDQWLQRGGAERVSAELARTLDAEQKVWVELPDYLKRLRTAADYEIAEAASRESLVEHGGDTSEYSPWVMLTGCLLFLGAGILLGLVVVG
jgi:hypothetical protein